MELPKSIKDDYINGRILSESRKGIVCRFEKLDGTEVCIKRTHATDSYDKEVDFVSRAEHPNIMKILSFMIDLENKHIYTISELMEGDLHQYQIYRGGFFNSKESFNYLRQISNSLSYIHSQNIIHRDIKSENILRHPFDRFDGYSLLKICDFTDSIKEEDITPSKEIYGTLDFLSPGLVAGEPASKADDIWALGISYYDWLTGTLPFAKSTHRATYKAITFDNYTVQDYFTEDETALFKLLLEKKAQDRITIEDLQERINPPNL